MSTSQVQIPAGYGPGMQFQVDMGNGQLLDLTVPNGYGPGMMLTFQVPQQQQQQQQSQQPSKPVPMTGGYQSNQQKQETIRPTAQAFNIEVKDDEKRKEDKKRGRTGNVGFHVSPMFHHSHDFCFSYFCDRIHVAGG